MEKGIKETKELLVGMNEITVLLAEAFKDGVQAADAAEVYEKLKANPELSAKILAAYNGMNEVKEEVADISFVEGIELVKVQMEYAPKIVAAIQKKA